MAKRRWKIAGVVAGILALPVAVSLTHIAVASWGRIHSVDDAPSRETGMVLGARAFPGRPSAFLAARLDVAVTLFGEGKLSRIIVSGDGSPASHNEPAVMKDYLVSQGIPADVIIEDPKGFDTYDSCVRARNDGYDVLTLISQDYHLRRAIAICRAVGVDGIGVGDTTMRGRHPLNWISGVIREIPANLKMEWDVLTQRPPAAER